jgi:hypothetical protein
MAAISSTRVWIGALAGGAVWTAWALFIGIILNAEERLQVAQSDGIFLVEPRYPFFVPVWILLYFAMSYGCAWIYARVRDSAGAGPKTAALVGCWIGFAAGFPVNFAQAAWLDADRMLPLGWALDLWVGAILAALVAGWLYKSP